MEITFLGTGSGVPSKKRNVSSLALSMLQERDEVWLFDCGEATQHQILHSSIKPRKIAKIFITHMHGDHIFGLPGLLSSRSFQEGLSPVEIYGPPELQTFVETSLRVSGTHLRFDIKYKPIQNEIIFEDEQLIVKKFELHHGIPSYGYIIEEHESIGHLIPEKLKSFGVKPGPIYQQIKTNKTTTLPNGLTIERDEVTGPAISGRKISILGDTTPLESIIPHIKKSDVLIHEATFSSTDDQLAEAYNHSTSLKVAEIAKKAQVKQLILNHVSSRYHPEDLQNELQKIRLIMPNAIYAEDFYTHMIPKEG